MSTIDTTQNPDQYAGLVVNDVGTELPAEAVVQVTLDTPSWERFEEMVTYLKGLDLPGLEPVRQLPGMGAYRSSVKPNVTIIVKSPTVSIVRKEDDAKIEEVLARVELAA